MAQHKDPLVFNALTGKWQNASNPGPSGQPLGLSVGTPGGTVVSLEPSVGDTIQVDGGYVGTIGAAMSLVSAAATEAVPGYSASVVFNSGLASEQIGQLQVSGLAANTAQATLMLSDSNDGTIKGTTNVGTIAPGSGTTWAFTSTLITTPSAGQVQIANGYTFIGTSPIGGGAAAGWITFTSFSNGWTGHLSHMLLPVGPSPGLVLLQWYLNPGGTIEGTTITTFGAGYVPASGERIPGISDGIKTLTSGLEIPHLRVGSDGVVAVYGVSGGATFFAGNGFYPLVAGLGGN